MEPTAFPEHPEAALLEQHRDFVFRIARQLAMRLPGSVLLEDLVQTGQIALLQAARNYRPAGATFETYATTRVRGAMIDEIRRSDWTPRSVHRRARAAAETRRRLEQTCGRAATAAEVADALGVPSGEYHGLVLDAARATVLGLESTELGSRVDTVAGAERDEPASRHEREEFRDALSCAIRALPERECQVVKLHYGNGLRLQEIADLLSVTVSRVCQIRKHAVQKLRTRLVDWFDADPHHPAPAAAKAAFAAQL